MMHCSSPFRGPAPLSVLLLSILLSTTAHAMPGAESYVSARGHERAGRQAEAIAAYDSIAEGGGPLAPYALARKAVCLQASGDKDAAVDAFYQLFDRYPEGPWVRMAQALLGSLYWEQRRYTESARHFADVAAMLYRPWWFYRYEWRMADAFLRCPDHEHLGFDHYARLAETTGSRQTRIEAADKLRDSPRLKDRLRAVLAYAASAEYTPAAHTLLDTAPMAASRPEYAGAMRYAGALTTAGSGNTSEGAEMLRQALEEYPEDPLGAETVVLFVRRMLLTSEEQLAQEFAVRAAEVMPKTEAPGEAAYWIARHYRGLGHDTTAIRQFLALAAAFPEHPRAREALFAAAEIEEERNNKEAAARIYARLYEEHPYATETPEGLFRGGRLLEDLGDEAGAIEAYERSARNHIGNFFAHRSAERLHHLGADAVVGARNLRVSGGDSFVRPVAVNAPPVVDLPREVERSPRYQRLLFFGKHGWDEAEWEALDLIGVLGGSDQAPLTYQVLSEAGVAYTAMQFAGFHDFDMHGGRRGVARMRVQYPRAYWELIQEIAAETGLDPYLILAVARQESTYRPGLTSSAGARGIMQLMPATAQWMTEVESALSPSITANLDDPLNSLRLGAYYIRRMINRSGGNLVYAIASYNAGPGNVDRWRDRFGNISTEEFADRIPFQETHNFVRRVLGNYAAYHSLYPEP